MFSSYVKIRDVEWCRHHSREFTLLKSENFKNGVTTEDFLSNPSLIVSGLRNLCDFKTFQFVTIACSKSLITPFQWVTLILSLLILFYVFIFLVSLPQKFTHETPKWYSIRLNLYNVHQCLFSSTFYDDFVIVMKSKKVEHLPEISTETFFAYTTSTDSVAHMKVIKLFEVK